MSYRLTPRAEADLEAIVDYISERNPPAAVDLLRRLVRRYGGLAEHPFSGPARDDIAPGIRHVVVGSYVSLYRVIGPHVEIVRVLHGKRDRANEIVDG